MNLNEDLKSQTVLFPFTISSCLLYYFEILTFENLRYLFYRILKYQRYDFRYLLVPANSSIVDWKDSGSQLV